MKAIRTKCLPATNTKPARIKAYDGDGNSVTLSVYWLGEFGVISDRNCEKAAVKALCAKLDWHGQMCGGWLCRGENVYVFFDDEETFTVGSKLVPTVCR